MLNTNSVLIPDFKRVNLGCFNASNVLKCEIKERSEGHQEDEVKYGNYAQVTHSFLLQNKRSQCLVRWGRLIYQTDRRLPKGWSYLETPKRTYFKLTYLTLIVQ